MIHLSGISRQQNSTQSFQVLTFHCIAHNNSNIIPMKGLFNQALSAHVNICKFDVELLEKQKIEFLLINEHFQTKYRQILYMELLILNYILKKYAPYCG